MAVAHLLRRSEFLRVAAGGRRAEAPGLILQALWRGDSLPPRAGLTASRKVGGAVQRNRARRRLRTLADTMLETEGALGYDFVLIARRETLTRPFALLRQDMERSLRRVGIVTP
jgi:ribonuclease P protein component